MTARLLLIVLVAAAGSSTAFARELTSRNVLQACPAMCEDGKCESDEASGALVCTQCKQFFTLLSSGQCGCMPGQFYNSNFQNAANGGCESCPINHWCEGGSMSDAAQPPKKSCVTEFGANLVTRGGGRSSASDCVNAPGYYYKLTGTTPSATICPVDTFSVGRRKQRDCVPCLPGYTTITSTNTNGLGAQAFSACVIKAGYGSGGSNTATPCKKGTYKVATGTGACEKCADGVTTFSAGSISENDCKYTKPGLYPLTVTNGIIKATKRCPQNMYCPGGEVNTQFDPDTKNFESAAGKTAVFGCDKGTWTQGFGAKGADECMVPPGHSYDGTSTTLCQGASYRADWVSTSDPTAAKCISCGVNIFAQANLDLPVYNAKTEALSYLPVQSSAEACYIKPGMGMIQSGSVFTGVNCNNNNYGVKTLTSGLLVRPCVPCGKNLVTLASAAAKNGAIGFTDPEACTTQKGYSFSGVKCQENQFNDEGNYDNCKPCPFGRKTSNVAAEQATIDNCLVAEGYGNVGTASAPVYALCPYGTYRDGLGQLGVACETCPGSTTTTKLGAKLATECNVCKPGLFGTTCGSQCTSGTYGTEVPTSASKCNDCLPMTSGFRFKQLDGTNDVFIPTLTVSAVGSKTISDCVAAQSQIVDDNWYIPYSGASGVITGFTSVTLSDKTFVECVGKCAAGSDCQLVTYKYHASNPECYLRTKQAPAANANTVVAFKALVTGRTVDEADALGLASGSYTFWKDSGAGLGADAAQQPSGTAQTKITDCLQACDSLEACFATVMTTVDAPAGTIASCTLRVGIVDISKFTRSVTRADSRYINNVAAALAA